MEKFACPQRFHHTFKTEDMEILLVFEIVKNDVSLSKRLCSLT
jgi:hypothetical protein